MKTGVPLPISPVGYKPSTSSLHKKIRRMSLPFSPVVNLLPGMQETPCEFIPLPEGKRFEQGTTSSVPYPLAYGIFWCRILPSLLLTLFHFVLNNEWATKCENDSSSRADRRPLYKSLLLIKQSRELSWGLPHECPYHCAKGFVLCGVRCMLLAFLQERAAVSVML